MSTYKKKDKTAKQLKKDHEAVVHHTESTTQEVFESVDSWANKAENWVYKRQKYLLIGIGIAVLIAFGYFGYLKFIKEPSELKSADEISYSKAYFDQALAMEEPSDSLLKLALNGGEGKLGFLDIVDEYGNTQAGNLARYYAGISYLKMNEYKKAIEFLDVFSSDDMILGPTAKGAIGDAFIDLNKPNDALDYYTEAYKMNENNFTTPLFLDKAAFTAMGLKDYEKALELYTNIKENYPRSAQARDIDAKINQAKYSK
jgi:tetratricopeptide (TPR) repeat protein